MNEQEAYMQDFLSIFETLMCWGPGSEADTTKAYDLIGLEPKEILEIGCGNGISTMVLAGLSAARITATDSQQSALDKLEKKINDKQLADRVVTQCVSMSQLGFTNYRFDLIWAEASIYIMGVENALKQWKPLLKERGMLVFSDLVWLTQTPSAAAKKFWRAEYPDMQDVDSRLCQIADARYQVKETFTISERAWVNYYEPLKKRLAEVAVTIANSQAVADIQTEINLYEKHLGEFGYQFFIVQKS